MKFTPIAYSATILLICSILFYSACKKPAEKIYVQEDFKGWTLFQFDSYWIYLNENCSRTDSCYVYDPPHSVFYQKSGDGRLYERIWFENMRIGEFGLNAGTDQSTLSIAGRFQGIALTSKVASGFSDQVSATCRVIYRYDSLIINDQRFLNVIHTRDTFSHSIKDYYFAENVGLIKFRVKSDAGDSTWSLLRYHVVQ